MSGLVRLRNKARAAWRTLVKPQTADALAQAAVVRADEARSRADWAAAASFYAAALALRPSDADTHVQHGHALKQAGRYPEAEGAYRAAVQAQPDHLDTYLHLGALLKGLGQRGRAAEVFVQALKLAPSFAPARDELIAMGERALLPVGAFGRPAALVTSEGFERSVVQLGRSLADWKATAAYPVGAYTAWLRSAAMPPPDTAVRSVVFIIDATSSPPEAVARTVRSLQDQRISDWTAIILRPEPAADLAVLTRLQTDPRFRILGVGDPELERGPTDEAQVFTAWLEAGTILDANWLSWTSFALERTGAAVAYSDHDHFTFDWRLGRLRSDPVLQGQPCPDDLQSTPCPPVAVLMSAALRADLPPLLSGGAVGDVARTLLLRAFDIGRVVHVPQVLAGIPTSLGPASQDAAGPAALPDPSPLRAPATIAVIIPTRDHADLLTRCVGTLRALADQPDRITFVIMDNRSQEAATAQALAEMQASGAVIQSVDEPFNWSRMNNTGGRQCGQDILLFANNDMEMLTPGWDSRLEALLMDQDRGVVGAHLVYPDGSIQHAGVAMGVNDGRPLHEGLGSPDGSGGPIDRWKRRRSVAAVTGAFLATRRDLFEAVGGFDEDLPIAYSDLDYCFRVRQAGQRIVFEPAISLIHYESRTRGPNADEKIAWDDHELAQFYSTWGDWIFYDPGINPQWLCEDTHMFDGFRAASTTLCMDWIDTAGRSAPGSIDRSHTPPDTRW